MNIDILQEKFDSLKQDNLNSKIEFDIVKLNLQTQIDELKDKLEFLVAKRNEIFYQKQLEKILQGNHSITKHGITDITTKDTIYEIKCWNSYKSCFGQLKSYSVGNENKRLCGVFYGNVKEEKRKDIIELFTDNMIEVYEITENKDGVINLEHLNKNLEKDNTNINDFHSWLDKHIVFKEGSVLKLGDVCKLYLGKSIGPRSKTKFKYEVEKFIKTKFIYLNNHYQDSKNNDVKYKGWINLCLF